MLVATAISGYSHMVASNDDPSGLVFALIFGSVLLVSILKTISESLNILVYTHIETGKNLFSISTSKPDKIIVQEFVDKLAAKIKSIRYPDNISQQEKLEIYSKHLEFLLREAVITNAEFEAIRKRLDNRKSLDNVVRLVD